MSQVELPTVKITVDSELDSQPASLGGAVALHKKCQALANNLWWSWHPDVINLFRDIDPIRWRQLDHNPIALLREITPEQLELRASEIGLYTRINHAYRQLKYYING